jgi:hypothetical protein
MTEDLTKQSAGLIKDLIDHERRKLHGEDTQHTKKVRETIKEYIDDLEIPKDED